MTLQNGLIYNREAYLWSDTAVWSEKGARIGSSIKTFVGTHWAWAAAYSGHSPHGGTEWLMGRLAQHESFSPADLLRDASIELRRAAREGFNSRLLFAFLCEHDGATMHHIAAEEMPGRAAFQPVRLTKFLSSGGDQDWYADYADADTPEGMREVIALQLADNGAEVMGMELEDPISDVIETRFGMNGIRHRQLRLIDGRLEEVPIGDGFAEAA